LKWDRILPDSQDYLNLAPLPIRPRTIFLAKRRRHCHRAMIVGVDVSAIPHSLFPLFATASTGASVGATLQFIGVHGLAVLLASGIHVLRVVSRIWEACRRAAAARPSALVRPGCAESSWWGS